MLAAWRHIDRQILRATRVLLFVLGLVFIVLVSFEVASRLVLETSIYFVHAVTLFLLVWFFLLGAGLALREGAHVGFDVVVGALPPSPRRIVIRVAHVLAITFFVLMIWSGLATLRPALTQIENALGISLIWVMLAFPIGFGLLVYHQVAHLFLGREEPMN
jgi:TRAP-type C4-dicarboxylate transport system permease small subunit